MTGGKTLSFEYNADGIRTEKTVSGEYTYTYRLDGDKVVEMVKSGVGVNNRYVFIYDNDGNPHAMYYYYNGSTTPTKYYYVLNLQGDVVQLRNSSNTVIANYTYDAWGKLLGVTSSSGTAITSATHIANINPIRYRGYFYDTETNLYYCNSRYYDPQTRRFVNADTEAALRATPGQFTDKNLFAYCDNNPVMRGDNGGEFWNFVVGGIVGGVVGGVSAAISGGDWKSITLGAVSGAASGLVAASGLGAIAQAGISAGISGLSNFAEQSIGKGIGNVNYWDVASTAILGGATSLIGTYAGGKLGKNLNDAGSELINKGSGKLLTGYVRQSVGQSHSALIRQGRKFVAQGIQKINTVRGISSSVGSVISGIANSGYSWAKKRIMGW